MSHLSRRTAVLLAAAAIFLGACSSDGDDAASSSTTAGETTTTAPTGEDEPQASTSEPPVALDPETYPAEVEGLVAQGGAVTEEHASCIADAWLGVVTVDRLIAAEVSPEQFVGGELAEGLALTESEAAAMFDAFGTCDVDLRSTIVDSIVSTGSATEDTAQACVEEHLTLEDLRLAFVDGRLGGDSSDPFTAVQDCLVG